MLNKGCYCISIVLAFSCTVGENDSNTLLVDAERKIFLFKNIRILVDGVFMKAKHIQTCWSPFCDLPLTHNVQTTREYRTIIQVTGRNEVNKSQAVVYTLPIHSSDQV